MARIDNLTNYLTDIAAAIKTKKGSQVNIPAANFDMEISNLPSGGTYQTKSINITNNGLMNVTPDQGYDAITVLNITTAVPTGQMKEYASETAMNNDIANIQEGEVVKVSSSANADNEEGTDYSYLHTSTFFSLVDQYDNYFLYQDAWDINCAFTNGTFYVEGTSLKCTDTFSTYRFRNSDWSFVASGSASSNVTAPISWVSYYECPVNILDENDNVVFHAPDLIVEFYLKETTMKKLVKEEDTIPESEIQDHYEIEYD